MPTISVLNNIDHKDLRIITANRPGLGDDVAWVLTFAQEFRLMQADYPLIFPKTEGEVPFE